MNIVREKPKERSGRELQSVGITNGKAQRQKHFETGEWALRLELIGGGGGQKIRVGHGPF